ncbi:MAG: 4-(cytidine 5'-diphospho)-2-C-methyl-D-erythritol kinase [Candidatus Omnitrophota bacterium]|nr:4-(cytidine 5'-diphospho)-2-C-methyl-D-erythritol kinase [Candidatus Omnitrophota bacterium]
MIHLRAPAKLNLYLRVLGKRPDGYHEIETVFARVDLADELTFEPARDLCLTCDEPTLSCGEDNLILRAARALQRATGASAGARIHLMKRIPIAAGLGGGSSDAATALRGLNELWHLSLGQARLQELAAGLGSDVPFFLSQDPFAIGRGRGERCEALPSNARFAHVLVVPPQRLSTADIYAAGGFDLTASKPSASIIEHALRNGSMSELATGLWNDLQPEAIRRCPTIVVILTQLCNHGCLGVSVSGSGPSVFGLCRDGAQAQDIAAALRSAGEFPWRIEVIQTDHPSPHPRRVGGPSRSGDPSAHGGGGVDGDHGSSGGVAREYRQGRS